MAKKKADTNYTSELTKQLSEIEKLLQSNAKKEPTESALNELFGLINHLREKSGLTGMNSITNLATALEELIAQLRHNKLKWPDELTAKMLSATEIIRKTIDDPLLSDPSLKLAHEQYLNEIKNFIESELQEENQADSDDMLSNTRFQDVFNDEAADLINQLEEKMLQLESNPDDNALVNDIFRIMHTLKGNSNMFGHSNLGEITHHLENIYDAIRNNQLSIDRIILDLTLQCVDHFRALINDPELLNSENKLNQTEMLEVIEQILGESKNGETKGEQAASKLPEDQKVKTYYIYFKPQQNIFDDGTNPLYFVYDLNEMGDTVIIPVFNNIPDDDGFDPERCYTLWHMLLATTESKEEVKEHFMFLQDQSMPVIQLLTAENLVQNDKFVKWFRKESVKITPLESFKESGFLTGKDKPKLKLHRQEKVQQDSTISSIRVASTKIDAMMNLISELVTKQAELSMLSSENNIAKLQELAESIESISRDLRDNAFSISLIPIERSVLRFQRLVRDVSATFNKKVDFIVEGKETELDKTVIEKIVDPIMHILRNSIDHGIESPEERHAKGKPETGSIRLKAYPSGAHVVIQISDDGAGINKDRVRATALKKGFISETDEFSTEDMVKLIISPGFSTAENVSEVSGRGVGMDVVAQKIKEIRGELDIETKKDVGTTLTIRLPLTISIIDSLLVNMGHIFYLVPLSVVERCAEVPVKTITEASSNYIDLDGEFIPFIDLHEEFEIGEERDSIQRLILVNHKELTVGLVVDNIIGNHQAVLKTLGETYKHQDIISGASILGNGEVALVLDTNNLVSRFMDENREEIQRKQEKLKAIG